MIAYWPKSQSTLHPSWWDPPLQPPPIQLEMKQPSRAVVAVRNGGADRPGQQVILFGLGAEAVLLLGLSLSLLDRLVHLHLTQVTRQ